MSKVVDPKVELGEGFSYRTVLYPGSTGLRFSKGKSISNNSDWNTAQFSIRITSALIENKRVFVDWNATKVDNPSLGRDAEIRDANLIIVEHFQEQNPGQAFSIESSEVLTLGIQEQKSFLDKITDPVEKLLPDLSDLSNKIGIALIVLAVGLAAYAGYKAFGKS